MLLCFERCCELTCRHGKEYFIPSLPWHNTHGALTALVSIWVAPCCFCAVMETEAFSHVLLFRLLDTYLQQIFSTYSFFFVLKALALAFFQSHPGEAPGRKENSTWMLACALLLIKACIKTKSLLPFVKISPTALCILLIKSRS